MTTGPGTAPAGHVLSESGRVIALTRRQALFGMGIALAGAPAMSAARAAAPAAPAPIAPVERAARTAKLQHLMRASGVDAILVEPGASLVYFAGLQWSRSERLTAAIIPAEGGIGIVTPGFEEPSVRERLGMPADIRTWQEHEDPMAVVAGWLRDRKAAATIGIEEPVRHFVVDGLTAALPGARLVSAARQVRACRMIKSPAEIALMQVATNATLSAYRDTLPKIRAGMTPDDISALMNAATMAYGGRPGFALVLVGEASAYPHGTRAHQTVAEGQVVLMDCGCTVEGYQSDISRTFVFGEATAKQRQVWERVREGQRIAFAAARTGVPAGSVDDAVRRYYEKLGYGPDYRLPGLSHRTGHGIGLDGHEPVNLVRGETAPLMPGMCFSNEPGLYLPGAFGVRLEDCFHMTDSGPRWFSEPPLSLDQPV